MASIYLYLKVVFILVELVTFRVIGGRCARNIDGWYVTQTSREKCARAYCIRHQL